MAGAVAGNGCPNPVRIVSYADYLRMQQLESETVFP